MSLFDEPCNGQPQALNDKAPQVTFEEDVSLAFG